MIAIGGSLGLMLVIILMGKYKKTIRPFTYVGIVLIAMAQVALFFVVMYTMNPPAP